MCIRDRILILAVILLLTSIPLLASQPANAAPTNIIYQVPITIDNTQSTATPNPFQQMIKIPISTFSSYLYDNNTSANFEFYYANNTIIPAWIESVNASTIVVWLKLYSIPASSSIRIYMGFALKSTNLLSNSGTTGIGEAPQLSKTYAQYDDGASVFNNYWNFAGTSLPSSLTETVLSNPSGASGSYSVNNGITISNTNGIDLWGSDYMITLVYDISVISIPSIVQAQINSLTGNSGDSGWTKAGILYQNSTTDSSDSNGEVDMAVTSGNGYTFQWQSGTSYIAPSGNSNGGSITYPTDVSLVFKSTSSVGGFYGSSLDSLTQMGSYESPTSIASSGYIGLFITAHDSSGTSTANFRYLLTRAYPPNGVMPSISFGSVVRVSLQISFYQTSLPSGTEWGIRLNNSTKVWWLNSSGKYVNFTNLSAGNYYYQVVNATGYYSTTYKGEITINVANVSQLITFKPGYSVSIKESGMPSGIKWWVNVSKQPGLAIGSVSASSTNRYNNFTEPNGSYTFTISSSEPYYIKPASNNTLQFSISGSGLSLNIYFVKDITYSGTGNRLAYANATLSYYAVKQVASSTTTISYSGSEVKNATYSEFEISTGGPFQYNKVLKKKSKKYRYRWVP